jgi:hypothetical protein
MPVSHIVTVKTEIRDNAAVAAACRRLGLSQPSRGTTRLFSGEATGLIVQLPDWRYPIVCNTADGEIRYDNYNGRWGDQTELDRFTQAYAIEKVRLEARRKGHGVTEQTLTDGSVKLTVQVAGGAA